MIPSSQPSAGQPAGSSDGDPTPTGPYLGDPTPAGPSTVPGPRSIGRFELRSVLGQGAFGTVYRAYDPQLDREVALKVPRFPPNRPDMVERFLREARAAARLRHPGIVATFEVGTASGEQFIASELVTGQTLRERLNSGEPPTVRQAVGWVRDLALALEYAHGQGIIHRDIKPTNIMIDAQNRAQLMDFGLAKRVDLAGPVPLAGDGAQSGSTLDQVIGDALAAAEGVAEGASPAGPATNSPTCAMLTAAGAVLGTPAYMSPEQAGAAADAVGPHSDQYSLGVVLYEVLTGHQPFEGSVTEVLRQVTDPVCQAPSPRALNPEVSAPLAAVCQKAMAKEPAQRYGSAADLAVDLQRWLNGQSVGAQLGPRRGRRKVRRQNGETLLTRALARAGTIRNFAEWYRGRPKLVLAALVSLAVVGFLAGTSWYVASLRRQAVAARHAAHVAHCDLYRERGRGKDGKALRFLAESLALALELDDVPRQQAAAQLLADGDRPLPRPPGLDGDAGLRWDLAAHLLLGRQLPVGGAWETLGERLAHAASGQRTGFGAGGQKVLTEERGQFRDARTGEPFGQPVPGDEGVVFIPGGQRALRMGAVSTVWDLDSGEVLGPKHEQDWKQCRCGFSPDGTKLVIVSVQPHLVPGTKARSGWAYLAAEIWDVTMVKPLLQQIQLPPLGWATVAVSNDGSRVALAMPPAVRMWTISNQGEISGAIEFPGSNISFAAFHPDGRHLLIAGGKQVELWESSGERIGEFLPAEGVKELVLSPQGGQVLTRGANAWQLWDMQTRRPAGLPLERLANVQRVAFHPDGRQLLTAADGNARLWPNPVVAAADRLAALRLWAQASTGFAVDAGGDLRPLEPAQQEECRHRFAQMAGLALRELTPGRYRTAAVVCPRSPAFQTACRQAGRPIT